jgi:hypothetical protein
LVSTHFEATGTPLDGVTVPSGEIMSALMSPSPRARMVPAVSYRQVYADGEVMVAEAGNSSDTSALLIYERP